jgi:hypothetical protein
MVDPEKRLGQMCDGTVRSDWVQGPYQGLYELLDHGCSSQGLMGEARKTPCALQNKVGNVACLLVLAHTYRTKPIPHTNLLVLNSLF